MGGGSWTAQSWSSYASTSINNKSTSQIYSQRNIADDCDPSTVIMRESRDSDDHPLSTPIIIGLDVTGSMGSILNLVASKLGELVGEILDRNPVTDPQIMFNAIGDAKCDSAPLQVTQFESDIRIAKQLTELYFEQGGGGNGSESYPLTWLFASRKTETDAFTKRGKKGFIFTIGDDGYPYTITKEEAKRYLGIDISEDILSSVLLSEVSKKYEVYHLCLKDRMDSSAVASWTKLMGERAIKVVDYNKIPEIIVSILEVYGGKDKGTVINSWSGDTSLVIKEALNGLVVTNTSSGLIDFN